MREKHQLSKAGLETNATSRMLEQIWGPGSESKQTLFASLNLASASADGTILQQAA